MGDVTALMMDVITEKSGHGLVPMAVSVCLTPAAPAPLPIPYPVFATSIEGIGDSPMRTKINGAKIATVGSVLKTCHGNEPGTLKEVVSLNTTGPCFLVLGAPIVLCELGMMGITGSICVQNKAPTPGAGASASSAGGAGGPGGGGGGGSGSGGSASGPGGPGGGGGAGGGGNNTGASGPGSSSGPPGEHQCQDGHPVDVVTGYVVDELVDLTLPGVIPLVWKRFYSSSRRGDTGATLGPGWAHGFEQRLFEEEQKITLREAEGRLVWFAKVKPGESTFHRRERMTLTREADGKRYRVINHKTRLTLMFASEGTEGPVLLRAIQDAWDNAITLEYEGARLSRVVDTAGREVRVAWKEARITRLEVRAEGQLQQWVDYGYGASGCLTSVTDALGGTEEYEYDRHNRMVVAGLKTGVRFQYEYEANTGRCKKTWGPKGLYAIELETDKASKTTYVHGDEPRVVTWNDKGLATREALPDSTVLVERAYDDDGFLVAKVNGAGEGEQLWYDERGNRIRVVDAMGSVTAWEYDESDRPARQVSADGLITEYTHDEKGSLTGVVYPSGEHYALSYDPRGRLTAVHDARGAIRAIEYDASSNVTVERDARGAQISYTYDTMGRPVTCKDALGRVSQLTYDRLGRAVGLRLPDGGAIHRAYDAAGYLIRETDALGHVTSMERSGMGVLKRLVQADGQVWTFDHTSQERIREIKNPLGEAHSFAYDDAGRVTMETTFDGRVLFYAWDVAGRMAKVDYPDKSFRMFEHDRAGLLAREHGSDGTTIVFQRDRMGRMLRAVIEDPRQRVETVFERDPLGRIVAERQGDRAIFSTYDGQSRRVTRALPNGATTRYAYDNADALIEVDHQGHKLSIERDALGRETRVSAGRGGVTIQSHYDAMDRLIEQRAIAPSPGENVPAVLVQRQWQYDRAGRLTRIGDGRWGVTTYKYDRLGQLLEARLGEHREVFAYDPAGSLVRSLDRMSASAAQGWKVAPGNLLTSTDSARYAYDLRGRRVGKLAVEQRSSSEAEPTRYVWDCRDRLREVMLPDGRRVVMTYDALGRRIRKDVLDPSSTRTRSVDFLWDGDALAADFDRERGVRCFVHRPGTLVPLLQEQNGTVFTCVNDHLGMPKELLAPDGNVVWAASHTAWGQMIENRADSGNQQNRGWNVESPFRLQGQVADEETGLCWTRFRCFDPHVGRWMSPDPLGFAGGNNLFAFDGSPSTAVDVLGLSTGNPHPIPATHSTSQAPFKGTPNSIHEQTDPSGTTVKSRTFYDQNGHMFARQDFDHSHGGLQPHEHRRTFNAAGQPISGKTHGPVPPGYDSTPMT